MSNKRFDANEKFQKFAPRKPKLMGKDLNKKILRQARWNKMAQRDAA